LCGELDLSWHPHARIIREEALGLTPARLRGIAEAQAPLLLFVDDDNVITPDYLERTMEIAKIHPNLGAWSGQVLPEFEIPPPADIEPFLHVLCIRELAADQWGNSSDTAKLPYGAGMCVRRNVAERYARCIASSDNRIGLDRKGNSLASSGDLDLALTSMDLGLGTGLFRDLVVTHLIPARRLTKDYILRLIEDSAMGHYVFEEERQIPRPLVASRIDRLVAIYKLWRGTPMQKAVHSARVRGLRKAKMLLSSGT
jgi:glycosyltransferase involved in cell wall biosynthesis